MNAFLLFIATTVLVDALPFSAPTAAPTLNIFQAAPVSTLSIHLPVNGLFPLSGYLVKDATLAHESTPAPTALPTKMTAVPAVWITGLPTNRKFGFKAVNASSSRSWISQKTVHSDAGFRKLQATSLTSSIPTSTQARSHAAKSTSWSLPKQFTNIDEAFEVDRWVWGQNLAQSLQSLQQEDFPSVTDPLVANASVLSVSYPKGSIDPSAPIKGGIGFYSTPLDLSSARNVSFSYSAFFPADFDFNKGGKLPGLYGGHGGCSGGNDAMSCFSTRIMFRPKGEGELYLYAPVGKQPKSVCNLSPFSYCSTVFGASLGRGSWTFARGNWTHLKQDIWLNTPGKADGGFNIWINSQRVLTADNVYFRDAPRQNVAAKTLAINREASSLKKSDGLLADLIDSVSLAWQRNTTLERVNNLAAQPVTFKGIMMHTFFGGHEKKYASPKDQSIYFSNLKLDIND